MDIQTTKLIGILAIPLIVSGVMHMAIVRFQICSWLTVPIHERAFGKNKTWRGFFAFPILSCIFTSAFDLGSLDLPKRIDMIGFEAVLGFALGFAYMLCELPNSYIKRRLLVPPGRPYPGRLWQRLLGSFVDQSDSIVGVVLVYALFFKLTPTFCLWLFVIGVISHLLVNVSLYLLKIRENPF